VVPGLLTILCSAGIATAQTDVAFVNICRDGSLGSAAIDRIRTPVLDHSGLDGIGAGPLRAALEQPLAEAAQPDLTAAEAARAAAWDAFSAFSYDRALELLDEAQSALLELPMTSAVQAKWFEVTLLEGRAHLQAKRSDRAAAAFRLASRLSPSTASLDPGLYLPETVRAYDRAAAKRPGSGTLSVEASAAGSVVLVDGKALGPAPYEGSLEVGSHIVTVLAPGHRAASSRTVVAKATRRSLVVEQEPLPASELIPALRAGLSAQPSTAAVSTLAAAVNANWLVLVRQGDSDALEASIYNRQAERLGPWVGVSATLSPLLEQIPARSPDLSPKRAATLVVTEPETPIDIAPDRPWYRTRGGIVTIVGSAAVVAAAVAVFFLVDRSDSASIGSFCGLGEPCR
jgi:tetratricopeptide (TPR) repeat protein